MPSLQNYVIQCVGQFMEVTCCPFKETIETFIKYYLLNSNTLNFRNKISKRTTEENENINFA